MYTVNGNGILKFEELIGPYENTAINFGYSIENIRKVMRSRRHQLFAKRSLDVLVSFVSLAFFAPIFLVICMIICVESKGSPIFSQIRWGMNGRKIRVYKFRSMRAELGDRAGLVQTVKNDPRVTRTGAFLRRTNIDELPQLLNVLKGDMSLVGPRCHAIGMMGGGVPYEELVPNYHLRHLMRPGITGLAQMRGLRGPTVRPSKARARVACDLLYVTNFTFMMDLKIILGTMMAELRGGTGF